MDRLAHHGRLVEHLDKAFQARVVDVVLPRHKARRVIQVIFFGVGQPPVGQIGLACHHQRMGIDGGQVHVVEGPNQLWSVNLYELELLRVVRDVQDGELFIQVARGLELDEAGRLQEPQ